MRAPGHWLQARCAGCPPSWVEGAGDVRPGAVLRWQCWPPSPLPAPLAPPPTWHHLCLTPPSPRHCTTPHHTTPHHTTPHHITAHHTIPHYTTQYHSTPRQSRGRCSLTVIGKAWGLPQLHFTLYTFTLLHFYTFFRRSAHHEYSVVCWLLHPSGEGAERKKCKG